jgi:hypothetical protein
MSGCGPLDRRQSNQGVAAMLARNFEPVSGLSVRLASIVPNKPLADEG